MNSVGDTSIRMFIQYQLKPCMVVLLVSPFWGDTGCYMSSALLCAACQQDITKR